MQVNVVNGGRSAFDAMLYNVPDNTTLSWLTNNVNKARGVLSGVADDLLATAANLYQKVNSDTVINAAKSLVAQTGTNSEYMIYSLTDRNMHEANYIMQQYIMANPVVNRLYQENLCNGFEETYYNPEPDVFGEDRLDYQRVMDGIMVEDGDHHMITYYSNGDDVELEARDQFIILDTWAQAENMILNGIDPTSPDSDEL